MTESKSEENYEIFTKQFEEKEIDLIKKDGKVWLSSSGIAKGLDIHRSNVNQSFYRHRDLLEKHSSDIQIITEVGPRETRIFDRTAFTFLAVRSNSDKALLFQEWVLNVIDNIINKGYHIEKVKDPYDLFVRQADMLKEAFLILKENDEKIRFIENKVSSVDSELKQFEQKYEEEKIITPKTKKELKDLVQVAVDKTGKHWAHYYNKIFEKFNIASTKNIPEKLAKKIVRWISKNQHFFIYGSKFREITSTEATS